jgi:membrane-bound serine protease (ClpP class)
MRIQTRILIGLIAAMSALLGAIGVVRAAPNAGGDAKVYVIDVHGMVWPGQASFVKEQLDDAAKQGASAVILDVDTFGGLASAATDIKDAIISHDNDYRTVGYVHNRALSSGSLITLSCKYIAMAPAATLGSAQPHPDATGGDPDPELLSWARKEFSSTAEFRGRNPAIAVAWVTAPGPLPALGVKEGDILTLTTDQALKNGYCDVQASGIPDILAFLKLSGATVVPEHMDFWMSAAEWISDPWITALILGLGLALVILEMLTMHSWGVAGIIGGVAVALVFIAHIMTGTAMLIGIIIFVAGIGLLLFETHVLPGHGFSAVAGLACIFVGLYLAIGGGSSGTILPFCTAMLVTIGTVIAFFAYLPKSRLWRLVGQNMQQRPAMGYVASADYTDLLGRRGTTASTLRPSGAAEIDGMRFTVVSEGSFLQPGSPIEVVLVQGSRIVVRAVGEE